MNRPLRVVKVGGSLLDRADIANRLLRWLPVARTEARLMLIAGGGATVDQLRSRWAAGAINDWQAHWAAIDAMDGNAKTLATMLGLPLVDLTNLPPDARSLGDSVVTVGPYLRTVEPGITGAKLPIGWEVTSDSIAARIAGALCAKLTLLKSCGPPNDVCGIGSLTDAGYVDAFFPAASVGLREVLFQTL